MAWVLQGAILRGLPGEVVVCRAACLMGCWLWEMGAKDTKAFANVEKTCTHHTPSKAKALSAVFPVVQWTG